MRLRPSILAVGLSTAAVLAVAVAARQQGARASGTAAQPAPGPGLARATFAGGCFWCMEPPFEKLSGVVDVISGYTGGRQPSPTYEEVSSGGTGHLESVQVIYDPARITYPKLLEVFWRNVDPSTPNRQFCDVGEQYGTAIFYEGEEQKAQALASRAEVERTKAFPQPIVTPVRPASEFYRAESYHQDYYKKNPVRYRFYRFNCGRDARLGQLWGESPH